jgi:hypothetical protein
VHGSFSSKLAIAVVAVRQLPIGGPPLAVEQVVGDDSLRGLRGGGESLANLGCEVGIVAEVVAGLWRRSVAHGSPFVMVARCG